MDQSEDEGFQSASNLTPDSQSEPSPLPDVDMWEALRTFEPGKRRCWESVGWYVTPTLSKTLIIKITFEFYVFQVFEFSIYFGKQIRMVLLNTWVFVYTLYCYCTGYSKIVFQ